VAVVFSKNKSDPLLREFIMEPTLADFGESVSGGGPGRVFKSERGDYWNTLMCYNGTWPTTLARYMSTDLKLNWTLTDKNFATVVNDSTGKPTGAAVGAIAPAMFYALPGAPPGTYIINSHEDELWAAGTYDPSTEKMVVNSSAAYERPVQKWLSRRPRRRTLPPIVSTPATRLRRPRARRVRHRAQPRPQP
jgi:hypothetical protein